MSECVTLWSSLFVYFSLIFRFFMIIFICVNIPFLMFVVGKGRRKQLRAIWWVWSRFISFGRFRFKNLVLLCLLLELHGANVQKYVLRNFMRGEISKYVWNEWDNKARDVRCSENKMHMTTCGRYLRFIRNYRGVLTCNYFFTEKTKIVLFSCFKCLLINFSLQFYSALLVIVWVWRNSIYCQ